MIMARALLFYSRGIFGIRKPHRKITHLAISMALAALSVAPAFGQPAWYDSGTQSGIEPGSPDFYQHQVNEDPAFVNGGFCAYFAFEDAMYYDANNGYANLYANNANWVTAMTSNFKSILNNPVSGSYPTLTSSLAATYSSYIATQGYGMTLGVTTTGNSGAGYSAFNAVQQDLLAGSNALILIGPGSTNQWWGFHVMDVVGFNASNHSLIVLDPDNNKYGGGGFPGTNTSPPSSGFYTNGFKVPVPYNLVYYNTNEPIPIESGWGDVGGPTNSLLQSYTVDAGGDITSGAYDETFITSVFAIGPVPEPSSIALGVVGATTFAAYWRRRRKKRPRRGR
jgi:hypothetical protein